MNRLKTKTLQAAQALNASLLEEPLIQEYQYYEQLIIQTPELKEKEEELKALQKELLKRKALNEDADDLMSTYQEKKDYYDTHPLIVNYMNLKEEVNALLLETESLINNELIKSVD